MTFGHLRDAFVCPLLVQLRWWWATDGTAAL
jgi:hypothetical protein